MRLTEVGCLTWERFDDSYDGFQGMRCFSLIDTANEKVRVKNEGSSRIVPLHNDVPLPPKATGRLFSYKINADGLCSHDAGWLPWFTQLINQPPDIRHCDKHRQAQFSHQFFAANQASVGRGQADFFSPTAAPNISGLGRDVKIAVLRYASFDWQSLTPV